MHLPAIATGFRLLAKCFVKSPAPSLSVGKVSTVASTTSIVDAVLKSIEVIEEVSAPAEGASKSVEKKEVGAVEKSIIEATARKTQSVRSMRTAFKVPQPYPFPSKVQVECAPTGGVLQACVKKDMELISAKHPVLRSISQKVERGEADELMNKVTKIFEEIDEMEKFRLQLRVPAFDEDLGDGVEVDDDPLLLNTWIGPAKKAQIALDIARCEMTREDVEDLLTRLYIEMNRLVVVHAKNREERKRMALEVSARIKEYAGVLLESQCEIRLAVECARVRSVVAKRITAGEVEYLASLTPGSSHIPSCDGSCVLSYLPRRVAEYSEVGSVPELTTSEGSRCSTPSEIPSTPRASIAELREEPEIMIISEEARPEVVPVKSKKVASPKAVAKKTPVRKATKVTVGGKPAWKL